MLAADGTRALAADASAAAGATTAPGEALAATSTATATAEPAAESAGARFGLATSTDYRSTFFEANPGLRGQVVVHHAVEQQVLTRYPGVVSETQMHSLENLRGIPNARNSDLHLSQIRRECNQLYRQNSNPSAEELLNKATEIDSSYDTQFYPSVR